MSLTFAELQQANRDRATYWSNGQPGPGLEFSVIELGGETGELLAELQEQLSTALAGFQLSSRVGEVQNNVKKLIRHQRGMAGGVDNMEAIADELGDVVICASLLANKLDLDLEEITRCKFNKTSDKHGFPIRL